MLVLSRKENQIVSIQENHETILEICIVEIGRGRVKLGFSAKNEIRIFRQELLEHLQADILDLREFIKNRGPK